MKLRLIAALLLIACMASGQTVATDAKPYEAVIYPVLNPTTITSIYTTAGNDTISAAAKPFGSVVVGQAVYGQGIPYGTTVKALPNPALDSVIVLSAACTKTSAGGASIGFGYFSSSAYQAGDWIGFPFQVYTGTNPGSIVLQSLTFADSSDVSADIDLVLFSGYSDSLGADNAAANVRATDFNLVLGIVSVTTHTDLGFVRMSTKDCINLTLPTRGTIYGRLIARGSVTYTSATAGKLDLRFLR